MGQAVVSEQDGDGRSWQTGNVRGVVCACRCSGVPVVLSCGTVDYSWGQHVCRLGHGNPAVGRS